MNGDVPNRTPEKVAFGQINWRNVLKRLAQRDGNFCRNCGRDHNMAPCAPKDKP